MPGPLQGEARVPQGVAHPQKPPVPRQAMGRGQLPALPSHRTSTMSPHLKARSSGS